MALGKEGVLFFRWVLQSLLKCAFKRHEKTRRFEGAPSQWFKATEKKHAPWNVLFFPLFVSIARSQVSTLQSIKPRVREGGKLKHSELFVQLTYHIQWVQITLLHDVVLFFAILVFWPIGCERSWQDHHFQNAYRRYISDRRRGVCWWPQVNKLKLSYRSHFSFLDVQPFGIPSRF